MSSRVREWLPANLRLRAQVLIRKVRNVANYFSTRERVFTRIYLKNTWGRSKGKFCSGDGSVNEDVVGPYIQVISAMAASEGFLGLDFVDIGCGDFAVGNRLVPLCSSYKGLDIVQPLIDYNSTRYGNEKVVFQRIDAVRDELPRGDVCFLRQVLQHLSNDEILAILKKLGGYRWVFITEHYPSTDEPDFIPNLDKPHGGDIRAYNGSAVCLTAPPFSLNPECVAEVLCVPGAGLGGRDPRVIKTFMYTPGGAKSR